MTDMKSITSNNHSMRCLLVLLALMLCVGCRGPWSKGWKTSDMWDVDWSPWSKDAVEAEVPQRIVNTWTDAVLHQSGKTPQRGFGGRVIFYGKDAEKPVQVEGQLVVYAFDESNRAPTDNKPTRRYVFPPGEVARRMSKSELGPSYSFWLPWDEVGGPQTDISLIARFEPVDGAIVIGEQTRHLLPGELEAASRIVNGQAPPKLPDGIPMRPATPTLAELAAKAQAQGGSVSQVQLASYEAPADTPSPPPTTDSTRRMTTTSISLPENFRLSNSGGPTPQATPATGGIELSNNRFATPGAAPPNYGSVAAPISMQQPGFTNVQPVQQSVRPGQQFNQLPQVPVGYPTFMQPQQSPLGNGFVAPLGPPQMGGQPVPNSVGQVTAPPPAQMMQGQPPLTTAAGWPTANSAVVTAGSAVSLPTMGTVQPMVAPPGSYGYPPPSPQAPVAPAFR